MKPLIVRPLGKKRVAYIFNCNGFLGSEHCRENPSRTNEILTSAHTMRPSREKFPGGNNLCVAEQIRVGNMLDVESEPVKSSQTLLDGLPSSIDETESQIVAQARTRTFESVCIAGHLRDVVSVADRSTASQFSGKRLV